MSPPLLRSSAQITASRSDKTNIVVSEYPLSQHQCFRAEIILRDGKPLVSIARWKTTPAGTRRTSQALEFGGHRTKAVADLLTDVLRVLSLLDQKEARQ